MTALSQPPSPPLEATQVDPISALRSSISFGRYVTESLEWEKWSTFTHNRYKEEAERYSKPGSVAQMKAYFEAHYKKKAADRAASLNEQQNLGSNLKSTLETEDVIAVSSEMSNCIPCEGQICESIPDTEQKGQDTLMVKAEEPLFESPGRDAASEQEKTPINTMTNRQGSLDNDKSTICSSKSRNSSGVPKPPVPPKSSVSLQKGKHNIANPDRKVTNTVPQKPSVSLQKGKPSIANPDRKVTNMGDGKRTMSRLLHLSSHSAEANKKPTSPILERILNSRFVKTLAGKTSKDSRGKPVRDSVPSSHHSAAGFEDKNVRYRSPLHQSISRRGKEEAKSESTLVRSETPGTSGPDAPPRIVASSVSFKSEEQSAKRKEFFERLEQKARIKMTEKEKLQHTKRKDPKQKSESSKTSSNSIKKVQENNSRSPWRHSTHTTPPPPCSASASTRTPSKLHDDISLSPWRHSTHTTKLPCSPSGSTRTPSKLKDTNSRSPWSHSTLACSSNVGTKTQSELQDSVSRSPWNNKTLPYSSSADRKTPSKPWRHTPVPSPSSVDKRTPSRVQDNNSRPPWRLATKGNHCKDINMSPFRPASSPSKKSSTHENSSPNIQLSHES